MADNKVDALALSLGALALSLGDVLSILKENGHDITKEELIAIVATPADAPPAEEIEAGAPIKKKTEREPRAKWVGDNALRAKKGTHMGWVRKNKGHRADTKTTRTSYIRRVKGLCEHEDFVRALLVAVNYHYEVEEDVKTWQEAVAVLEKFWLE